MKIASAARTAPFGRGSVAFLLVVLSACGGGSNSHPKAASGAAPVAVQTKAVAIAQWPEVYEASGTVRARAVATASSRVMAYVQQVPVQVGDRVRQGQILATLDARDLEANLRRAEAGLAEIQASIAEADNGAAAAKSSLDLAQATFHRMEELAAKKSISNQEFDEASARLRSARANYDMARARRTQLDAKMAQVEQEIRAAAITRDYAQIAAPFAGIVTAKSVEPGNLATPGAPLLTLEREGAYRLETSVDESKLPFVKEGQAVEVALDAMGGRLSARVSEIVPAVDAASRTYTVKIDLPAGASLRSGMFGRAWFPMGVRNVIAIPVAALVERGQVQSAFVVEDGAAHTRLVTTGRRLENTLEVLSGLSEGEAVIVPVPPRLADGARVEARP
jgi:RND family efflux transporter MFP subunit